VVEYANPYDIPGALSYVGGVDRVSTTSGIGLTIPLHADLQEGDIILLVTASEAGLNIPSGYTTLSDVNAGGLWYQQIFWKIAEAADVGSAQAVTGNVAQMIWGFSAALRPGPEGGGIRLSASLDDTITGTTGDYEYISGLFSPADGHFGMMVWSTLQQTSTTYGSYNPSSGAYDGDFMYPTQSIDEPHLFAVYGFMGDGDSTPTRFDATSYDLASNAVIAVKIFIESDIEFGELSDTMSLAETFDLSGSSFSDILTDSVSFQTWSVLGGELIFQHYTDTFSLSDATEYKELLLWALTDGVGIGELDYDPIHGLGAAVAETIEMTPALTGSYHGTVWERLAIQLVQQPGLTFGQALQDALSVAEAFERGDAVTVAEALQMRHRRAGAVSGPAEHHEVWHQPCGRCGPHSGAV